jgi:energy-coupling factor transport system substrate-specific component
VSAAARPTVAAPPRPAVVRIGARTAAVLTLVSLAGLAMFLWPLLIVPPDGATAGLGAPVVFLLVMPAILAIVMSEVGSGELDTKAIAMLGVLTAIGAALRPLGAGVAGIETVFFVLVLAGRVYGPGFGFVLGTTTMFASAILTGGLGPWLPFQMLASGWVGLGAGLLPRRVRGRAELAMLAAYGAVSAFAFGFVLNIWFWPYTIGADTQLSYVAGAPVTENLHRFFLYTVATSTLGWDMGRAITNVVAILVLGPTILAVLHRAARRAAFDAAVVFDPSPAGPTDPTAGPATDAYDRRP